MNNPEIDKLEAKLSEMREELLIIRPLQVSNHDFMGRTVTLAKYICECEKMLANARVADFRCPVNKGRIKSPTNDP